VVALLLCGGCATRLIDNGDGGMRSCGTLDLTPSLLSGANTTPSPFHAAQLTVAIGNQPGFTATTVDGSADSRAVHLALHGAPASGTYRLDIDVTADQSASLDYKDSSGRWLSLDGMLTLQLAGTATVTISAAQMRADTSTSAQGRFRLDGSGSFDPTCAQ
jgi:hypothetical protein